MHIPPQPTMQPVIPGPNNPTDSQRYEMLYNTLAEVGRTEDFNNIIGLLAPPPDITRYGKTGEFKNIKVGIIGGGLAGMSAAFELRKLGYDITIFEPITKRIGGRVYTYYFDEEKRLYGELGAMRIPVSHETTWHYINLFKLNTETFIQSDPNTFTFVRDVRVRNDPKGENVFNYIYPRFDMTIQERNTPWPQLYNNVVRYYLATLPPDVRKQTLMVLPRYDYRFQQYEAINSREAFLNYGLSDEAINLMSSVNPFFGSLINQSFEVTLNEEYSVDFMNLYRIQGGMVNFPLAFYNSLTSQSPKEYPDLPQDDLGSVKWMGGHIVTGILKFDRGPQVTLRYRTLDDESDRFEKFDYVVCCVPFPVLRGMDITPIFTGKKMQAIREIYYEDAQKTLFLCNERFWEKYGIRGGISYTDEIIETVTYPPSPSENMQYAANQGVLLASYNLDEDAYALGNMIPETRFPIIRNKVEKVHGLPRWYLRNIITAWKSVDWVSEPWFYGAFQMFFPRQKEEFLYVSSTPEYDNRVFFAGEHTSTKNGWMQGALQSGMRAANHLAYYTAFHRRQG